MPEEPLTPTGEIILYPTEDGRARVECRFAGETVWLTQALMAELFDIAVPTVNEHLKGIYEDGELDPGATIRKFRIVRREGAREVARNIEPLAPEWAKFFQIIPNKLHFAATGQTAAELIAHRADHSMPNMGLTTWKGGAVRKAEVTVAKTNLTAILQQHGLENVRSL